MGSIDSPFHLMGESGNKTKMQMHMSQAHTHSTEVFLMSLYPQHHSREKLSRPSTALPYYKRQKTGNSSNTTCCLEKIIQTVQSYCNTHPYLICGQMVLWLVCFLFFIRHSINISCCGMLLSRYCIWVSIQNRCWGTVSFLRRWWAFVWGWFAEVKNDYVLASRSHKTDQKERGRENVGDA